MSEDSETEMNELEKETFNAIIIEFENYHQAVIKIDNLTDNATMRTAMYNSCVKIFRDGPRLKSSKLQEELVKYYTELRDQELKKVLIQKLRW